MKLHDIGKLKVSKATLTATGKLTPEQVKEILAHPGEGVNLLRKYGITTKQLVNVIGAHHEKFTGGGYPTKRPTKDMPLSVRIANVVDSFDAMTNSRGYNTPKTVEEALKDLNDKKGTVYDPEVVAIFMAGTTGKNLVTKETGRISPQLLNKPSEGGMAITPFKQVVKRRWQEREATRAEERVRVKEIGEQARSKLLEGKSQDELAEEFVRNLPKEQKLRALPEQKRNKP